MCTWHAEPQCSVPPVHVDTWAMMHDRPVSAVRVVLLVGMLALALDAPLVHVEACIPVMHVA